MKVLFIGGTGIISEAASKMAVEHGMDLYLLNRGNSNDFAPAEAKLIQADIRDKISSDKALGKHKFDVVVDWVAFEPGHVKNDIDLFKDRTEHYIFISSASAYQKPVSNYVITESTPLKNPYWKYSRDKIACEELLMREYRNSDFPVTIIRPSLTYGLKMIPAALNSWDKPWSIADRMRRGQQIIVHGDGTSLWTMTHNKDFAKGLIGLFYNKHSIGHAFHITSDEVLNWNQIYESIGFALGCEPNVIHIPSDFIAHHSSDAKGSLIGDKAASMVFDNSKIKRFVPNFEANIPFFTGIKDTVKSFEAHPKMCAIDKEWNNLMDDIITRYKRAFL
ncbi:MAG: SDR family oxidoreductase [Clostridium sp.]|nr:SDR family oxidoreductase [Clostridium sp.]